MPSQSPVNENKIVRPFNSLPNSLVLTIVSPIIEHLLNCDIYYLIQFIPYAVSKHILNINEVIMYDTKRV